MLYIALSPGKNVAAIYNFLSQVPVALPFTPVLTSAPNDWLLALKFVPGDISVPRGLAIDQSGNIWIANAGTNSITKLSATGMEISPSGGYTASGTLSSPEEIFIDSTGKVWVTNYGSNTVEALNSAGAVVVSPFGSSTLFNPTGIVVDSFSQVWVTNTQPAQTNEQITVSTNTGSFSFFGSGFGLTRPNRIIADTTTTPNIMWVANNGTGGVSQIINDGTSTLTGTNVSGGGQTSQQGITIDGNGDVWVANSSSSNGSLNKIQNAAPPVALGPVTGGGITSLSQPWGITTDGANNVWVNNFGSSTVTELDTNGNALSPATGFTAGGLIAFPRNGIAVDRSGNVWVLDDDFPPPYVTVLLGAAAPVATPRTTGRPIMPGSSAASRRHQFIYAK